MDHPPGAQREIENETADLELPDYANTVAALPRPPPAPSPPEPPTPRRTPSNPCVEFKHNYKLKTSRGHPWLYLALNSRAPDERVSPLFFDKDKIEGEVGLNLERMESIRSITITLRGGVTAVGQEEEPFLEESQVLWTPSIDSSGRSPTKLIGKYTWPFSLTLPDSVPAVSLPRAKSATGAKFRKRSRSRSHSNATPPVQVQTPRYLLPNSFSERASPIYVDYKLVVTVKKGYSMWSTDQTLTANLAYLHRSIAQPPSTLCVLAYEEGTPQLGPEADPEGWKVFAPVTVHGTLFNTRPAEVQYTLSVASPLSYAVNSPISLLLTIQSTDSQALDLLTTPSVASSCVYLRRTLALGSSATSESMLARSNNNFTAIVARAVFWPQEQEEGNGGGHSSAKNGGMRSLRGEIFVAKNVKPSMAFHRFSLRYHLVFVPPQAVGFTPSTPPDEALVSERAEITLLNAPGVQPRSHAPPGYTDTVGGDYNVTAGYLENGNQRFYHLHGFTTR